MYVSLLSELFLICVVVVLCPRLVGSIQQPLGDLGFSQLNPSRYHEEFHELHEISRGAYGQVYKVGDQPESPTIWYTR